MHWGQGRQGAGRGHMDFTVRHHPVLWASGSPLRAGHHHSGAWRTRRAAHGERGVAVQARPDALDRDMPCYHNVPAVGVTD